MDTSEKSLTLLTINETLAEKNSYIPLSNGQIIYYSMLGSGQRDKYSHILLMGKENDMTFLEGKLAICI